MAATRFEVAILYAGRCGFTQDRALAHERYGEHLWRIGQAQDAEFQMGEAVKLYDEWGAHAKVRQIQRIHQHILGPSTEICIELPNVF